MTLKVQKLIIMLSCIISVLNIAFQILQIFSPKMNNDFLDINIYKKRSQKMGKIRGTSVLEISLILVFWCYNHKRENT